MEQIIDFIIRRISPERQRESHPSDSAYITRAQREYHPSDSEDITRLAERWGEADGEGG